MFVSQPPHQRDGPDRRSTRRHRPGHPDRRDERATSSPPAAVREAVRVVTPMPAALRRRAHRCRGAARRRRRRSHHVDGMSTAAEIGELAADAASRRCTSSRRCAASLEDAFMELTHDAVEYRSRTGRGIRRPAPRALKGPTDHDLRNANDNANANDNRSTLTDPPGGRAAATPSGPSGPSSATLRSTTWTLLIARSADRARHASSPPSDVPSLGGHLPGLRPHQSSPWRVRPRVARRSACSACSPSPENTAAAPSGPRWRRLPGGAGCSSAPR